ncbi:Uma2 family endonuclease [Streptomyces sp. R302]|uniref:Uma2 family endonuclease n=1 Tax=unclassified Streptomyces TaxID=2593676 RepID=UPI00145C5B88|nr:MULTISPECIES: Uma2 family endonuclease [unclassified Streptomyces]NML53894.1 Uma2 family endonuclease [Streptomyces sp. R301]NML83153.1 Uma2 family endonuclease [Streptomyces sp. R302]
MAMPLPTPEETSPEELPDVDDASVQTTFELFSASAPRGWRVELIEGEIYVVPPANGEHEEIVSELSGQVRDHDKGLGRYTGIGLSLPGTDDTVRVIPDLAIAPKGSFGDKQDWHAPDPVLLVAEVTSTSTAGRDRGLKIRAYARAAIPVYLLIDREAGEAVVCSEPVGDDYTHKSIHRLGAEVPLPAPLGFTLDTAEF